MPSPYVVRPRADRDIDELADYLAEEGGLDIGLRFLAEVHETCSLLSRQPAMGWSCRLRHPHLRTAATFRVSERFDQYLIFYQPLAVGIEVLRVIHGTRDLEAIFLREGLDQ